MNWIVIVLHWLISMTLTTQQCDPELRLGVESETIQAHITYPTLFFQLQLREQGSVVHMFAVRWASITPFHTIYSAPFYPVPQFYIIHSESNPHNSLALREQGRDRTKAMSLDCERFPLRHPHICSVKTSINRTKSIYGYCCPLCPHRTSRDTLRLYRFLPDNVKGRSQVRSLS